MLTPEEFIARGWDECAGRAGPAATRRWPGRTPAATRAGPPARAGSPRRRWPRRCCAALRHADDPVAALGRAAATNGDSDSIACLAGAFLGAAAGMAAWPADWAERIEYADQLAALGAAWD